MCLLGKVGMAKIVAIKRGVVDVKTAKKSERRDEGSFVQH